MALTACRGQAGQRDRTGVAGVAFGAGADSAIGVWFAYGVALIAAGRDGRMALRQRERIGRAFRPAWLELLTERDLLGREALLAMNGSPTGRSVAATQKLLVNAFVARSAVSGSQVVADDKAMVIHFILTRSGLVAVEAGDAFFAWADISYS